MTVVQKKVIDRLRELGGAAWCGPGIDKVKQTWNSGGYLKDVKAFYGESEWLRLKKHMKKHGITNKGVWCSHNTLFKLIQANLIENIEEIPGAFKVVE